MPHREGCVRLQHMLDHAREAVAMAAGRSRDDLDTDRMLNLSLVRLLEVIGEAAGRTTDSVDFDVLWQIISADLPQLVSDLEQCFGAG